jgi:alanine racemase
MDLVCVDVTELGSQVPVPGEMAEILGPNISVDDQGDAGGTLGYEILTALRLGRYARRYVDGPAEGAV